MSKRLSRFDLCPDFREYLIHLLSEAKATALAYRHDPSQEAYERIGYMRDVVDLHTGYCDGLDSLLVMQKKRIAEHPTLRKNAKRYLKRYYKDGLLSRIDTFYVNDSGNHIRNGTHLALYRGHKRYLIPYDLEKNVAVPPCSIIYVTVFENHSVTEEYQIDQNQIIYNRYTPLSDGVYAYTHVNYVHTGTYPILGAEVGTYQTVPQISYHCEHDYCWYDEFDAKRKGLSFSTAELPDFVWAME